MMTDLIVKALRTFDTDAGNFLQHCHNAGVKPMFEAFVGARGTGKDGDAKMGESHLGYL